jgi:hypothetical protein
VQSRKLIPVIAVAAVVLVLLAGYLTQDEGEESLTATIIGSGSNSSFLIDLSRSDFEEHGVEVGDRLMLDFGDVQYQAYYVCEYSGLGVLDFYLSCYSDNQYVVIGIYYYDLEQILPDMEGVTFTVTDTGEKSPYFGSIPNYLKPYSDDLEDFDDIQEYGNYRELTQGDIQPDRIYRSASPFQKNGTRYLYCDDYLESVGVDHVFSISVDYEDLEDYRYDDSYSFQLYDEGNVVAKKLKSAIFGNEDEILFVMDTVTDLEGSIGISCSQGKDRTGVYCAMLESLAGASYQEVREDFLLSMCNYYSIERGSEEYDTVGKMILDRIFYVFKNPWVMDDITVVDWEAIDISEFDAEEIVSDYLLLIGMSTERLQALKDSIRC